MIRWDATALRPRPHGVGADGTNERHFFGCSGGSNDFGMGSHSPIMHGASIDRKCQMHQQRDYLRRMSNPAERLKQARIDAGYDSASMAAEAMGIPVATYVQHENGSRGYPSDRAERYARFFRTTPEWLLYGRETGERTEIATLGPQIPIQGVVQAGVFRERMEYPEEEWETFTGAASIDAPLRHRFGLRVAGDSMNEVYPPGTILECVRYWGDEPIVNGKRVIVQRVREDGEVETTVKEYRNEGGVEWLIPRSTNPAFQAPFRCDKAEEGIVQVSIIAIVIASTRYE